MKRAMLIGTLVLSVVALTAVMPSASMACGCGYGGYGGYAGYGWGYPAAYGWGSYSYPMYYGGWYGGRGWYGRRGYYGRGGRRY
jgi:hypothetical protein